MPQAAETERHALRVTHTGVRAKVEILTPEIAARWLEERGKNRPLSDARVRHYARQMVAGEWLLTGEPMILDNAGLLVEGQHRAQGVVDAEVSIETLVVRGVDPDVFRAMNTGKARNARDLLSMDGETNCNALAGALTLLWRHRAGGGDWATSRGARSGRDRAAPFEIIDLLDEAAFMRDAVGYTEALRKKAFPFFMPSSTAFAYYVLHHIDAEKAKTFMSTVAHGLGLAKRDAIHRLRLRYSRRRESQHRLTTPEYLALMFKAWNFWRDGTKVQQLTWRRTVEPFPEPK